MRMTTPRSLLLLVVLARILVTGGLQRASGEQQPRTNVSLNVHGSLSSFRSAMMLIAESMTGAELADALATVAAHDGSFFSLGGLRADVRCDGPRLRVTLTRGDGRRVRDDAKLRVLTTDFLATGGDGFFGAAKRRTDAVSLEDGPPDRKSVV